MQNLFNVILKMSVSTVPVIIAVLCLRVAFKKYPKSYSFALWIIVFASLAIPFKIPVNITLPTENKNNTAVLYVEHLEDGVIKTITDENSVKVISEILASQNWQEGTADCLSEFKITLDGKDYYYHSDCGTINYNKTDQSLSLNDTQKSEIDRIIASMPQTEKASESNNTCGYPTQECFTEETESVNETETTDQWSAFSEVFHLPVLEIGKYIWPAGPGARISRGYSMDEKYDLIPVIENNKVRAINKGKVIDIYSDKENGKVVVVESYNEADEAASAIHYPFCKETLVKIGEEVQGGQNIAVLSKQINTDEYRCQAENTKHDGIDIAGPFGTEIFASADGKVIKSEESTTGDGNHIVIEHANGYYTLYGHCSELFVKVGDEVKQGDLIAKMGSTGNSTGNHLHFEFGFGYGSEPNGGLTLDPYSVL